MFTDALFGMMAILTFLSIGGSWIHIFRNLGHSSQLPPTGKLAFELNYPLAPGPAQIWCHDKRMGA
jgi:hypothetical protein